MGFQQGLSGLNATSKNLEVIGNNVANANTFGFKSARAEFADMYATSMNGTGASNIGIGVNLSAVAQQFTQGNIVTTENPMDLALNGAGFFQVTDGKSPVSYTRNGQFKVDRDGWVVNNAGEKLLGYPADGTGVIQPGTATPLRMPTSGIDPAATANMSIEMNLDSRAAVTKPAGTPQIKLNDPKTYNNATSVTVFDAKGQDVALSYYFQKTGTDQWDVFVTANGNPINTDASGNPLPSTSLTFNSSGSALLSPTGAVTLNIPASTNSNGAQTLAIAGVKLDLAEATQNGSSFAVTDLTQDGYAPGQMVGIQFEPNGVVTARYSNGQSKPAGQVEIANFRNPQGLVPLGGNGWSRSYASGEPVLGVPGDGNLGVIQSGALEESNVDLTGELVNMITAQRIYQANAQTIKTEDQVMQTLVNLR